MPSRFMEVYLLVTFLCFGIEDLWHAFDFVWFFLDTLGIRITTMGWDAALWETGTGVLAVSTGPIGTGHGDWGKDARGKI